MKKILLFLFLINAFCAVAQKKDRLALLIGNNHYVGLKPLESPHKDVDDMKDALDFCGFDVVSVKDGTKQRIEDAVREFSTKLKDYKVGMFYYSGHGAEIDGINYIVPSDLPPNFTKADIRYKCVSTDWLQTMMAEAGSTEKTHIILLDACRNDPFKRFRKDIVNGNSNWVTPAEVPMESIVCYATSVGQYAEDGGVSIKNSEYTSYFLKHVRTPGLAIEDLFKRVRLDMHNNRIAQIPTETNKLYTNFYFVKPITINNDRDGDGIPNDIDDCPDSKGTKKCYGCPSCEEIKTQTSSSDDHTATATEFIESVAGMTFSMKRIKASSFTMGSNESSDETPHTVILNQNYSLSKYEVTVGEFKNFIDDTNYKTDAEKEGFSWKYTDKWEKMEQVNWRHDCVGAVRPYSDYNHPVIHVSWNDAVAYCEWLKRKTGKEYRLPTEAEWEYAAGNGTKHTKYSWGNGNPTKSSGGNVADETKNPINGNTWSSKFESYNDGYWFTAPVGQYGANDLGLYDMTGNVWEWCSDWYDENYYSSSPSSNPKGASSGTFRVLRGGSWVNLTNDCRVAFRGWAVPSYRSSNFGIRVCLGY